MSALTGTDSDLLLRDAAAFVHQEGSSPCIGVVRAARGGWSSSIPTLPTGRSTTRH